MTDPLGLINNTQSIARPTMQKTQPQQNADGQDFKSVLRDNIEQVNKLQQEADKAIEDLAAGRRDDVANIMIAKQKADTALKMLMQVRNKIVDAYQEVKQMRV